MHVTIVTADFLNTELHVLNKFNVVIAILAADLTLFKLLFQ